jgi:hypothetical protein
MPTTTSGQQQSPITDIKRNRVKARFLALYLPSSFTIIPNMPPQRTPLGPISSNRQPRQHISPYWRGVIAGESRAGSTPTKIAKDLNLDRETVRRTVCLDQIRDEGESLLKAARKLSYSPLEERHILRWCRLHPKSTYTEVKAACHVTISTTTIKKILKCHGITNWKCKRRPLLTLEHAQKRLAWCLKRRHWNDEEWGMVAWSDECSVERGRGKRDEWCFRTPLQKWEPRMVQTYGTNKNMKTMVWAMFWDNGRSNLYIMDRDFESQKHGYSANSYLEVLEAEVRPAFESFELGYEFMQDNASIHTARKVKEWFHDQGIIYIDDWPPYSPDLNPIEHIWWALKVRFCEMFPEVAADKSESEYSRQRLESCLQAAYDTLDKSLFDSLYQSMPRRIEACIQADGWHTKY